MKKLTPVQAMALAIQEGRRGAGRVAPNPLVGCVILDRDGQWLASGAHEKLGHEHAEINALKNVADPQSLNGAQVFVTLEPCAHQGRTPSCAKALAQLPIASVTYGLVDPDERVRGQGAEILRQAGKQVELFAELKAELEELCEIFLINQWRKRPFVALKTATSLDGKIALRDGRSQWITGEVSRAHVHELRGAYDAVLVGAGTFRHDNPRLNSRSERFKDVASRVVVLDAAGETREVLARSNLLSVRAPENVWVVTTIEAAQRQWPKGVHVLGFHLDSAQNLPLNEVLDALWKAGIFSLFVEGGAHTYVSLLRAQLVDRLYLFQAPILIGEGLSWTSGWTTDSLDNAPHLDPVRVETLGRDRLWTGRARFQT